jgi:hypothetical protein
MLIVTLVIQYIDMKNMFYVTGMKNIRRQFIFSRIIPEYCQGFTKANNSLPSVEILQTHKHESSRQLYDRA